MAAYAPYKYNPGEMPPEEMEATFVGRQPLLDRLVAAVREQTEAESIQHYLILGPRGIGKTTLLLMLHRKVKRDPDLSGRWLVVQYREEEFFAYTLRDLLALALEYLAAEHDLAEAGAVLAKAEAEPGDERSLAIILDGLRRICESKGKRILLLVDNFDQVFPRGTKSDTGQRAFRKLLSTESLVMVVGTSVRLFEDIAAYDEAFFNFFSPIDVDTLSDDDIQEQLLARARADENQEFLRDYERHRQKVKAITYLTGGNPRLVVMLYEILSERRLQPVVETLRETIDNLTPLLKHVLEDLPQQQSKTLDALLRLDGVASPSEIAKRARLGLNAVATHLGRLKQSGFVTVEGEGRGRPATYRVRDQMFRTWYQMRYLRPARRRVELFVEFLRAWFSVEERMASLEQLKTEFDGHVGSGQRHRARETAVSMEYLAASFDDRGQRADHMGRAADAYLALGDLREAALSLADQYAEPVGSQTRYEASGYTALGHRLVDGDDILKAKEAYSEAIRRDPANVDARMGLGFVLGTAGDHAGALREFMVVADSPEAGVVSRAMALWNRGLAKGLLGDTEGTIADYTAVLELEGAPADQVARALYNRGVSKGMLGDTEGEIADYTAVLELEDAPADQVAQALFNRGVSKGALGDTEGEIADYTAVVELRDAPADQVAAALLNRGVRKVTLGDTEGAIADYTAVVELGNAPADVVAKALFDRGTVYVKARDYATALEDFDAALATPEIPDALSLMILAGCGLAHHGLRHTENALADFSRCAENCPNSRFVHLAVNSLIRLLCEEHRTDDAVRWMSRLDELEPDGTPMEQRLEVRVDIVTEVARTCSLDVAAALLDAAIEAADPDLRARLAFLKPALGFARTGEESALAKLPDEEQRMAKRIAATIRGMEEAGTEPEGANG